MGQDQESLQGDLRNFGIFELTQSMMMGRKTALITIQHDHRKGFLYFEDGKLTSALDDTLQSGEMAAYVVFSWQSGRFKVDFGIKPRDRNVKIDTQSLLMEVARRLDEHQRDHGETAEGEQTEAIQQSLQDRFSSELNRIFSQVAQDTAPTRDRFSVNAFDGLLLALTDLGGSALFLRPDTAPRVKIAAGFRAIRDEPIRSGEIEAFLEHLLPAAEAERFRRTREISASYATRRGDHFRVSAVDDGGRICCVFSPASKRIPALETLGGDLRSAADALDAQTGLLLLSGPLAGGKSTVLASLIDEQLDRRDRFVALYSRNLSFDFPEDRGFLVRSDLARFGLTGDGTLASVIEQGADVVAIDEIRDEEAWRDALAVAARTSLVLALVEADGREELAERISAFAGGRSAAKRHRQLAHALIGVLDLDLRGEAGVAPRLDFWRPDESERARLGAGDVAPLAATLSHR
ncbi:MAG: DUF4388 domain-containing protein [Planctomycetota bacterium]